MNEYRVKTPIALVVFNRPEFTKQVFDVVKKAKPYKLYIIQDGAREENDSDVVRRKQVAEVFNAIDWDCDVKWNVSEVNLGCCKRPYTGFSWVFEQEETAIFLEDDCIPSLDYFKFCDYVLEKYKNDTRVMLVSGTNIQGTWKRENYSYHFSSLGGIHGWASWRRAWKYYDVEIKGWDDPVIKSLVEQNMNKRLYVSRQPVYDRLMGNSEKSSAWDFQWGFARMIQNGLAIVPCENMIKNIGYCADSTHTTSAKCKEANIALGALKFPLVDPPFVMVDKEYDEKFIREALSRPIYREILSNMKKKLLGIIRKK